MATKEVIVTTWWDVVEKMKKPVERVYLVHAVILPRAIDPHGHVASCINCMCPTVHV